MFWDAQYPGGQVISCPKEVLSKHREEIRSQDNGNSSLLSTLVAQWLTKKWASAHFWERSVPSHGMAFCSVLLSWDRGSRFGLDDAGGVGRVGKSGGSSTQFSQDLAL